VLLHVEGAAAWRGLCQYLSTLSFAMVQRPNKSEFGEFGDAEHLQFHPAMCLGIREIRGERTASPAHNVRLVVALAEAGGTLRYAGVSKCRMRSVDMSAYSLLAMCWACCGGCSCRRLLVLLLDAAQKMQDS